MFSVVRTSRQSARISNSKSLLSASKVQGWLLLLHDGFARQDGSATQAGDLLATVLLAIAVLLAKSSDLLRGGIFFGIARDGFIMSIMTAKGFGFGSGSFETWKCLQLLAFPPCFV
jgi:hypothetical protein